MAGAASASFPLDSFSGSLAGAGGSTGGEGSFFTCLGGEAFLSFLGDLVSLSRDLLLFLLGSGFFSGGASLLASTPMLVATASIAWILAVAAAAATALAEGMAVGVALIPVFPLESGGVMALPTLRY